MLSLHLDIKNTDIPFHPSDLDHRVVFFLNLCIDGCIDTEETIRKDFLHCIPLCNFCIMHVTNTKPRGQCTSEMQSGAYHKMDFESDVYGR